MDNFLAQIVANFIERSCGSYKTTVAGLIAAAVTSVGAFTPFVPPKYHAAVIAAGAFLGLVAGAMGKDK
jgi:hypothetical protein